MEWLWAALGLIIVLGAFVIIFRQTSTKPIDGSHGDGLGSGGSYGDYSGDGGGHGGGDGGGGDH